MIDLKFIEHRRTQFRDLGETQQSILVDLVGALTLDVENHLVAQGKHHSLLLLVDDLDKVRGPEQQAGIFNKKLSALTPAYRRIVEMVVLEGLTPQQVADQLGQPVKCIKTNIREAVKVLTGERPPLRSMRMTSAPMSENSMAANGPGPIPANSTIRIPCNGPMRSPIQFAPQSPSRGADVIRL